MLALWQNTAAWRPISGNKNLYAIDAEEDEINEEALGNDEERERI